MELDPKGAETRIEGFWETVAAAVTAHPKTAIAIFVAVVIVVAYIL